MKSKVKTYVITFSTVFPTTHRRAGEPTGFVEKILNGEKIHTIRGNPALWTKRIAEVNAGTAELSLRTWTGKPYRSPQREFARIVAKDQPVVEEIMQNACGWYIQSNIPSINGWVYLAHTISKNDGLVLRDFLNWFPAPQEAKMYAAIIFAGPSPYNHLK